MENDFIVTDGICPNCKSKCQTYTSLDTLFTLSVESENITYKNFEEVCLNCGWHVRPEIEYASLEDINKHRTNAGYLVPIENQPIQRLINNDIKRIIK